MSHETLSWILFKNIWSRLGTNPSPLAAHRLHWTVLKSPLLYTWNWESLLLWQNALQVFCLLLDRPAAQQWHILNSVVRAIIGRPFKNFRAIVMVRIWSALNIEHPFHQVKENVYSTSPMELLPYQRLFKLP